MKYYSLSILPQHELIKLAEFIVSENYKHHCENSFISREVYQSEVVPIYIEELQYRKNSVIYVKKDEKNKIIGSIRVTKWDYIHPLPIEKIFSIDLKELFLHHLNKEIWHIGRFAIKKRSESPIVLFKQLMVCAINTVCKNKNSLAIAECDEKLLKTLRILGIQPTILAEGKEYLGSNTIPVLLSYETLNNFLLKNNQLLPQEVLQDFSHHPASIFNVNYTFV